MCCRNDRTIFILYMQPYDQGAKVDLATALLLREPWRAEASVRSVCTNVLI